MSPVTSSIPAHPQSHGVCGHRTTEVNRKQEAELVITSLTPFNCATDLQVLINHSLEEMPEDANLCGDS